MNTQPVTILHLSDTQFGSDFAYSSWEYAVDTLIEDLRNLSILGQQGPDLILVTVDIVSTDEAKRNEYKDATKFFEKLTHAKRRMKKDAWKVEKL